MTLPSVFMSAEPLIYVDTMTGCAVLLEAAGVEKAVSETHLVQVYLFARQ